jgi:beta-galactosidase
MKKLLPLALSFTAAISSTVAAESPRERTSFNDGWLFQKDDPAEVNGALAYPKIKDVVTTFGAQFLAPIPASAAIPTPPKDGLGADVSYVKSDFNDAGWRKLNLPHDWGIEGPFKQEYPGDTGKLPWWGVGWYRKHFEVPAADKGKQVALDFDGAMSHALVWVNGHFVGGWPYGYASFRVDLTPYLKVGGENVVAVRLDNPPDSSRWYPGGGIYRNVWMVKTEPVHIAQWGTYVTTPEVSADSATVSIKVTVQNDSATEETVKVHSVLLPRQLGGGTLVAGAMPNGTVSAQVPAGKIVEVALQIPVKNPNLWSVEKPYLYSAATTIERGSKVLDRCDTTFGIRTIKFTADGGFFLNGKALKLQGVCDHHDLGALGSAINIHALQRQVELLKEMGCNAIRTSHNPPAPELLDLCDKLGMVVMDESFDCWSKGKRPNDYHLLFPDWHEKDMRAFVRRDRNHPCVILWSIGNEIPEQGSPLGIAEAKAFTAMVHEEDPTRPTTLACSSVGAGYTGYQNAVDVFGYNYKPFEYQKWHEKNPAVPLFGSETASCISSRGEYFFPVSDDKAKGESNFQVSSYDLSAPRWAMPPDAEFKGQDANPFVAGEFVWTGFDYLGEPTPYNKDTTVLLNFSNPEEKAAAAKQLQELGKLQVPSRSSYFGILDLCGFKKDRFYLYQARWRPDFPMAHLLPHWNWPDRVGQVTPVFVYTSGDEAELFLNGKSLGRKKKGQDEYRLRWDDIVYAPGELKVIAYKAGKRWAEDVVRTTGASAKIKLAPNKAALQADGTDLSFVTVSIADAKGLTVPTADNEVHFSISGPGKIVAVDNGDATSLVSFQSPDRQAFNGLALVIVRSEKQRGTITLTASSKGLKSAQVALTSGLPLP